MIGGAVVAAVAGLLCVSLSACLDGKNICGNMKTVTSDFLGTNCTPRDTGTEGIPEDTNPEGDGGADAASGDGDSNSDGDGNGLPTGMGDDCTSSDDCTQEADYCNIPPDPSYRSFCTVTGCTWQGDDCPEGYACFDWAQFGSPNMDPATICIPEEDLVQ